jgi:hypothetical protein
LGASSARAAGPTTSATARQVHAAMEADARIDLTVGKWHINKTPQLGLWLDLHFIVDPIAGKIIRIRCKGEERVAAQGGRMNAESRPRTFVRSDSVSRG